MFTLDGPLPPTFYRRAIGVVRSDSPELRSLSLTFCSLTPSLGYFACYAE